MIVAEPSTESIHKALLLAGIIKFIFFFVSKKLVMFKKVTRPVGLKQYDYFTFLANRQVNSFEFSSPVMSLASTIRGGGGILGICAAEEVSNQKDALWLIITFQTLAVWNSSAVDS